VEEEERGGGAPFIAAKGGGTKAVWWWNCGWQTTAVATVGTLSARSWCRCLDSEVDERAPHRFQFFPIYPKLGQL
jgi:hypothetical protein